MKIIVAGGREFKDKDLVFKTLDNFLECDDIIEIVSGTARGADTFGEEWAKKNNKQIHYFTPDWDKFSKRAGFIRNEEMAKFGDALIAFWDGESKGTKHMIELAYKYKILVKIIKYEK